MFAKRQTILALILVLAASTAVLAPARAAEKICNALPLSTKALMNGTYVCPDHKGPIKLKNGQAAGKFPEDPSFGGWMCQIDKIGLGDINGDGVGDAAVILGYNGGGSGYFVHLVAMINKSGRAAQGDSYDLGDRVEVKDVKIANQKVTVTMMDHAPDEGLAMASLKKVLTFQLNKGRWQKISAK